MKDILEDFQVEEPEGLWDAVSAGLPSAPARRNKVLKIAVPSLAAVAAALAVFFVLPGSEDRTRNSGFEVLPRETVYAETLVDDTAAVGTDAFGAAAGDGAYAVQTPSWNKVHGYAVVDIPTVVEQLPAEETMAPVELLPAEEAPVQPSDAEGSAGNDPDERFEESQVGEVVESHDGKVETEDVSVSMEEFLRMEERTKKTSRRGVGLVAMTSGRPASFSSDSHFGVFSGSALSNSLASMDVASAEMKNYSDLVQSTLGREVTTEYRHRQPVRLSLEAEYRINGRLALATGLAYSRLVSDLKSGAEDEFSMKQSLNYLGIPLKLNVYALEGERAYLYASAGVMTEKCVGGRISTDWYFNGDMSRGQTERVMDKPLQFSLNASLGAGIRSWEGIGLFVEPGLSWYIPNGGLSNIYKEKPLNFSLSVGIRTEFGSKGH